MMRFSFTQTKTYDFYENIKTLCKGEGVSLTKLLVTIIVLFILTFLPDTKLMAQEKNQMVSWQRLK